MRRRRMGFKMACALDPDNHIVKVEQNNEKSAHLPEGRRQTEPLPGESLRDNLERVRESTTYHILIETIPVVPWSKSTKAKKTINIGSVILG